VMEESLKLEISMRAVQYYEMKDQGNPALDEVLDRTNMVESFHEANYLVMHRRS
jgi:hypothetical protein